MALTDQQIEAMKKLLWSQSDQQVVQSQLSKQDKKIATQDEKMNAELTWDKAVDSVITTPQSEWTPYQIAVANLNPDLKSKNKKYQTALNTKSVLENERVNLWQAWELMMNAYRNAIDYADNAAREMMNANSANAALQAWAMTSWSAWLATNPAAAAQTRLAAQNQATIQNMQIRSNADQNIANIYNNIAQMPWTLSSIAANNNQADLNAIQTAANANLANAQATYYGRQWSSTWWSTKSSGSSKSWWSTTSSSWINLDDYLIEDLWDSKFQVLDKEWNVVNDPDIVDAVKKYVDEAAASINQ